MQELISYLASCHQVEESRRSAIMVSVYAVAIVLLFLLGAIGIALFGSRIMFWVAIAGCCALTDPLRAHFKD